MRLLPLFVFCATVQGSSTVSVEADISVQQCLDQWASIDEPVSQTSDVGVKAVVVNRQRVDLVRQLFSHLSAAKVDDVLETLMDKVGGCDKLKEMLTGFASTVDTTVEAPVETENVYRQAYKQATTGGARWNSLPAFYTVEDLQSLWKHMTYSRVKAGWTDLKTQGIAQGYFWLQKLRSLSAGKAGSNP